MVTTLTLAAFAPAPKFCSRIAATDPGADASPDCLFTPYAPQNTEPRALRVAVTVSAVLATWTDVERMAGAGSRSWYVTDSRRSAEGTLVFDVENTDGCTVQDAATHGDTVKTLSSAAPVQ